MPKAPKFTTYFSILGVIVLEEPADEFSNEPSQEASEAFEVDKIFGHLEAQPKAGVESGEVL